MVELRYEILLNVTRATGWRRNSGDVTSAEVSASSP
jgi:hypothetical protein